MEILVTNYIDLEKTTNIGAREMQHMQLLLVIGAFVHECKLNPYPK